VVLSPLNLALHHLLAELEKLFLGFLLFVLSLVRFACTTWACLMIVLLGWIRIMRIDVILVIRRRPSSVELSLIYFLNDLFLLLLEHFS